MFSISPLHLKADMSLVLFAREEQPYCLSNWCNRRAECPTVNQQVQGTISGDPGPSHSGWL